jgi:hypothetical protein
MPGKIANLDKPKTKPAKAPRKPRGRKPAAKSKSHKTPPGRGATRLRNSVNSLVSQQADEIAKALIDKTKAGNMTGARILVELSGAGKPPDPVKKKHGGLKLIDLLESDSEWDFDTDPDTPHPGCEWNGERWVRPEQLKANS